MARQDLVNKYKADRSIKESYKLNEDENYLIDKLLEAMNYTRSSTKLKDEENNDFKYWYTINRYTKIDDLTFKKGNEIISKTELYKYWRSKINPLIV